MSEHTPTPWEIWGDDEAMDVPFIEIGRGKIGTSECRPICQVACSLLEDDSFALTEQDQKTAKRIVACVNAFHSPDGRKIATEDIAEGLFWRMYDALNWSCITKERHDEKASLLSSLKVQGPET